MFRGWRWNGGKEEGGLVGGEAVKAEKSRGEGMEAVGADSKQKRVESLLDHHLLHVFFREVVEPKRNYQVLL